MTLRRLKSLHQQKAIQAMHQGSTAMGSVAGYYLVASQSKERYFIATGFWDAVKQLNASCIKHLPDTAPDYWVDRSIGLLIDGTPGWINIDHTDGLLDAESSLYQ